MFIITFNKMLATIDINPFVVIIYTSGSYVRIVQHDLVLVLAALSLRLGLSTMNIMLRTCWSPLEWYDFIITCVYLDTMIPTEAPRADLCGLMVYRKISVRWHCSNNMTATAWNGRDVAQVCAYHLDSQCTHIGLSTRQQRPLNY